MQTKTIPIHIIRKSPLHWNRAITKDDVEELADSIDSVGMIHPIVVRKKGQMYEYLAGERRYLACKSRGDKVIRCTVVTCADSQAREISLVENLKTKRPDSNEWKQGVKELYELEKKTITRAPKAPPQKEKHVKAGRPKEENTIVVERVAKKVGVAPKTVERAISVEKLTPTARLQFERGNITQAHAEILSKMSKDDQWVQLSHMIRETRKQTETRLSTEKIKSNDPDKASREAVRTFTKLLDRSKTLQNEVDAFRESLNDNTLDVLYRENRDNLVDLHRSLSQLIRDIELAENGI